MRAPLLSSLLVSEEKGEEAATFGMGNTGPYLNCNMYVEVCDKAPVLGGRGLSIMHIGISREYT